MISLFVVAGFALPFVLHDDDDDGLLLRAGSLEVLEAALQDAYIQPINDGGGNPANNQNDAPFVLKVRTETGNRGLIETAFRRQAVGADDFWVVYVLMSYQPGTVEDRDPDGEGVTSGVMVGVATNTFVVAGGRGSQVFVETVREHQRRPGAPSGVEARVLAHEVGHQMGLDHWDEGVAGVPSGVVVSNLMLRSVSLLPNDQARFVPQHLHLLRLRVRTPGQW